MRRYTMQARLLMVVVLATASLAANADFSGRVVGVLDGDTIDVLVDQQPRRVRLAEIDAPEKKQAFGARARQALSGYVFGQVVRVRESGSDRYGRTIGSVVVDGQSINRAMIAAGMAWAYRRYLVDRSLLELEAQARQSRRGLWADSTPVAPWEWRNAQRAEFQD